MSQPDTDTPADADTDESNPPPPGEVYRVGNSSVYHTTDCYRVGNPDKTMSKPVAEGWDSLSECHHCINKQQKPGSVTDKQSDEPDHTGEQMTWER